MEFRGEAAHRIGRTEFAGRGKATFRSLERIYPGAFASPTLEDI
jgi:hypothetical protein